jgi:hypothetical protein
MTTDRLFLVAAIGVLLLAPMALADEPPDVYINRLVETWKAPADSRDAVGFALSVAFVYHPSRFFRIMNDHPDVFRQWLETIDKHTLNRHEPSEPTRGRRVFREVHDTATKWSGTRYRAMAKAIASGTDPETSRAVEPK